MVIPFGSIKTTKGVPSVTIAYPIVDMVKYDRLLPLAIEHKTEMRFVVDSEYGLNILTK